MSIENLEKKVESFLRSKPSYLQCSSKVIARYSGVDSIRLIKRIKNKVNLELNDVKPHSEKINPVEEFGEGFFEKFKEVAGKLGFVEKSTSKTLSQESELFIPEKKDTYEVATPSINEQAGMHIMIGCHHVPFHNERMHRGIIQLINDYKSSIKGFHLLGDFLDLNSLSSHDRGRFTAVPGLTLDGEYAVGNRLLDEYEAVLPKNVWKTYLWGNHEDRYSRWMKVFDNSKTPLVSPTDALSLWERGYQVKDKWSQDYFTIGKHLDIFHGIYFNIHSAKKHIDSFRGSCMYVHTHRIQTYIEGNTGGFNIGTAADLSSPAFGYASRGMKSQWQNGFAITMIDKDGSYHVTQIICQDGYFYFGGKKYGY